MSATHRVMRSVQPTLSPETEALLSAVRDQLADQFSTQVTTQTMAVADLLEAQADQAKSKDAGAILRGASSTLACLGTALQNGIASSVRRQFDRKLKPASSQSLGGLTLEMLTLVDEAQMQEEIAIGKAASRLKEQVNFEFYSLSRRIGHLLNIEHIVDRDNPVFPGMFAQALIDGLAHCGIVTAQRTAIFEASGPMLIEILPQTYQAANDYLIEQGVVIEIKESYGRVIPGKSAPPVASAGSEGGAAVGSTASSIGGNRTVGGTVISASTPTPAQAILRNELSMLLHQVVQHGQGVSDEKSGAVQRALGSAPAGNAIEKSAAGGKPTADNQWQAMGFLQGNLRTQMQAALQVQSGFFPAGHATLDTAFTESLDLTQLVAAGIIIAAFNRLLASPPLREHVGALLLQLQMPVIKAMFAEPVLLTDDHHVVRKTLDRLAEFAIAQPDLLRPGTSSHESLATIIGELAANIEYDAAAFAKIAEKIDMLFAYHEEAAAESDPKAQMMLEIELMESAINSAHHAIESRLQPPPTGGDPEFICTFARVIWKEVLFSDMLNGGAQGELWRLDIETLEVLLSSVRPQDTTAERAELVRRLPALQSRLDEAAASVQVDPAYLAQFNAQLRDVHSTTLSGVLRRPDTAPAPPPRVDLTATMKLKITGEFTALPHLMRGQWIEFEDEDTHHLRRARLNWMSPISAVCLFKDYLENETFTIELKSLDEQIRKKQARQVESLGISRHAIDYAIQHLGTPAPAASA